MEKKQYLPSEMWDKGFRGIGEMYLRAFSEGKLTEKDLAEVKTFRMVLKSLYNRLIKHGTIYPIEMALEADKRDLKEKCGLYCQGQSQEDRMEFCISIWVLANLIK